NRCDVSIGARTASKRSSACRFDSSVPISLCESTESETGAISPLRVTPLLEDLLSELRGGWADGRRPRDDPRGRPSGVLLVRRLHVRRVRRVPAFHVAARVQEAPPVRVAQLDRGRRRAYPELLVRERELCRVEVVVELRVVVDVQTYLLPRRALER